MAEEEEREGDEGDVYEIYFYKIFLRAGKGVGRGDWFGFIFYD